MVARVVVLLVLLELKDEMVVVLMLVVDVLVAEVVIVVSNILASAGPHSVICFTGPILLPDVTLFNPPVETSSV